MACKLSRRAQVRQASLIAAQIMLAVTDLNSADEQVRAGAVRALCPCRTRDKRTLDRYVVPCCTSHQRWCGGRPISCSIRNSRTRWFDKPGSASVDG